MKLTNGTTILDDARAGGETKMNYLPTVIISVLVSLPNQIRAGDLKSPKLAGDVRTQGLIVLKSGAMFNG